MGISVTTLLPPTVEVSTAAPFVQITNTHGKQTDKTLMRVIVRGSKYRKEVVFRPIESDQAGTHFRLDDQVLRYHGLHEAQISGMGCSRFCVMLSVCPPQNGGIAVTNSTQPGFKPGEHTCT